MPTNGDLVLVEERTVTLGAPALGCCGTDRSTSCCLIDSLGRPCDYEGHYLNDCPRVAEARASFLVDIKRYRRQGGITE
jgi:hypothetical protein